MGSFSKYQMAQPKSPWQIHPIWRGIGCFMLVLIPVMSYAAAVLVMDQQLYARFLTMPAALLQTVVLPFSIPVLGQSIPHLYGNLLVAFVLAIVGFGALTIIYSIVWSIFGPSRYGPQDAPPARRTRKKRRGR